MALFQAFISILTYAAAAVVMIYSVCKLNGMTHRCSHLLRVSFVLMAAGAFGVFLAPVTDQAGWTAYPFFLVGLALQIVDRHWGWIVRTVWVGALHLGT